MHETRAAQIQLRSDGIILVEIKGAIQQKPEDARANLAQVISYCTEGKKPLLVDLRKALPLDAETRHIYKGKDLENSLSCLAMVTNLDPLGVGMVNVYMKIVKLGIPTRLFTDFDKAVSWLGGYR